MRRRTPKISAAWRSCSGRATSPPRRGPSARWTSRAAPTSCPGSSRRCRRCSERSGQLLRDSRAQRMSIARACPIRCRVTRDARARAASLARKRRRRRATGRGDRRRACSCCWASRARTTPPTAERLGREGPRAAHLRRRRRAHERAARRARDPLRQPVHAVRRHAQGQPPELRRRGAGRAGASRCTSASASAPAPRAASSART